MTDPAVASSTASPPSQAPSPGIAESAPNHSQAGFPRSAETRVGQIPNPRRPTISPFLKSAIRGSSTTVRLDVLAPQIGRRRERDTDYKGWGDVDSRVRYSSRKTLGIDNIRVKVYQKWRGGLFDGKKAKHTAGTGKLSEKPTGKEKARVDLGIGVDVGVLTMRPGFPELRLKLRVAENDAVPKLTLRASPNASAIVTSIVPLSFFTFDTKKSATVDPYVDRGVCAKLELTVPLEFGGKVMSNRSRNDRAPFVSVKLVRPEGRGLSLSTNGVELDFPNLLNIANETSDAFALRLNASVDFPRHGVGVGGVCGGIRDGMGKQSGEKSALDDVRVSVRKLGVKKVTRWWTRY